MFCLLDARIVISYKVFDFIFLSFSSCIFQLIWTFYHKLFFFSTTIKTIFCRACRIHTSSSHFFASFNIFIATRLSYFCLFKFVTNFENVIIKPKDYFPHEIAEFWDCRNIDHFIPTGYVHNLTFDLLLKTLHSRMKI